MSNRSKFILSIIAVFASIILLGVSAILAAEGIIGDALAVILTVVSVVLVLGATAFAAKVDYETGVYECKNCGHVFKPKFMAYLLGPHSPTTRRLKCPECGKTTWCKRKTTER